MANRFQFDDEIEEVVDDNVVDNNLNENIDVIADYNEEEEVGMAKKKKKLKPWVIVLLVIVLVVGLFGAYLIKLANNDGPVYGNRCDGAYAINVDARNNTISAMKEKYSDITDLTIEINCKQIQFDITFVDEMNTKKAIDIAEKVVQSFDDEVGLTKDEGKTYSQLFGYLKNEAQYDCQLTLSSKNSKDFTIYGTKHHSLDEFSYTYASVKDEDSKNKAQETLNKE